MDARPGAALFSCIHPEQATYKRYSRDMLVSVESVRATCGDRLMLLRCRKSSARTKALLEFRDLAKTDGGGEVIEA